MLPLSAEQPDRLQTATGDLSFLQLAWISGYFWGRVAEQLRDDLIAARLDVVLINAGDYKFKQIAQEKLLLIVTSTQGGADPSEEAVAFII